MTHLERVNYANPQHLQQLQTVWQWMEAQPEYLEATGYESLDEFLEPPDEAQWMDLFCWCDNTLAGMFSLVLHADGEYEVHLAIPARSNLKAVTTGLGLLKRNIFERLDGAAVYVVLPRGKERKSARYAQFMGFYESTEPRKWSLTKEQYYGRKENNHQL